MPFFGLPYLNCRTMLAKNFIASHAIAIIINCTGESRPSLFNLKLNKPIVKTGLPRRLGACS